jgi:hypothetical protein
MWLYHNLFESERRLHRRRSSTVLRYSLVRLLAIMWLLPVFKGFNTEVLMSSGSAFSYYLLTLICYSDRILMRPSSSLLIFLQVSSAQVSPFLLSIVLISNRKLRSLLRLSLPFASVFWTLSSLRCCRRNVHQVSLSNAASSGGRNRRQRQQHHTCVGPGGVGESGLIEVLLSSSPYRYPRDL